MKKKGRAFRFNLFQKEKDLHGIYPELVDGIPNATLPSVLKYIVGTYLPITINKINLKSTDRFRKIVKALTVLVVFVLFLQKTNAQSQLLDSLSLDTLTAFTSIEEAMKNPEQVIKLELRKRLKKFPPEILKFINLQYLDLSKNDIGELPDEIGQLKNLQYLAISRSGLQEFPTQIGELTNLYYLEANNNDLTSLPTEIGKLEKLKTFDLWSNDIDKFPTELRNLKSLKLFDLRVIMIPDAEQARVQSLLPHTKVFFSPYCKCEQ